MWNPCVRLTLCESSAVAGVGFSPQQVTVVVGSTRRHYSWQIKGIKSRKYSEMENMKIIS